MLRVGTAGWSYPDWEGIVYPKRTSSSRRALEIVAGLFDTVEINVTFYRPPTARMAASWVERVSGHAAFRFTAKLWQGFTHQRDARHDDEEVAFKEGLAPLVDAGRLGAVLIQFPHSFRNTAQERGRLESILDRFAAWPLVAEFRHVSWMTDGTLDMLAARGVGFCNVDQPASRSAIPPSDIVTGGIGYVRLHGRNAANWFRKDAGRDERYDYLYSHDEIATWVERIRSMQRKSRGEGDIFIIANNHYRGQAPANALEIAHRLLGHPVEIPDSLLAAYPRLEAIGAGKQRPGMLPL